LNDSSTTKQEAGNLNNLSRNSTAEPHKSSVKLD
jgi:hypothetical protein